MDENTIILILIMVSGALSDIAISFIKRVFDLNRLEKENKRWLIELLTLSVCFFATSVFLVVLGGDISIQGFGVAFTAIVGASQIVYKGVMKPTNLDELIERYGTGV